MLGEAGQASEELAEGTICGRRVTRQVEAAVHRAHGGQVGPHAFRSLEAARDPQPDCVEAEILARNGNGLDVGKKTKFYEGFLLRVE